MEYSLMIVTVPFDVKCIETGHQVLTYYLVMRVITEPMYKCC